MIRSFGSKIPRIADSAFISEAAYVVGNVEIGENSSVWPGAVIRGDFGKITIGKNSVIEDNCMIHSGSQASFIGDDVIIGHGAVSHCHKIGNNILIGMNSTILMDAEIGDYCIVAAGCTVKEKMKIPNKSFVVGVPGEIRGEISSEQQLWLRERPSSYYQLARQYKLEGL